MFWVCLGGSLMVSGFGVLVDFVGFWGFWVVILGFGVLGGVGII